jgi:nucleoside-diphosphate-sugar epimerase
MSVILVTGASGFIGSALSSALSSEHEVVGMSRRRIDLPHVKYIPGEFGSFGDLRQLDKLDIDVVVHLGAVTGGATERDCMLVNVEGTRCLMRYLIDRGCKKFVMASSIAAVGMQNIDFRPDQVPIPDEHPCYDRDGYGFSKFMMEEVTKYHWRQNQDIDVVNLRLSSVAPEDKSRAKPPGIRPLGNWSLGSLTVMLLPDAIRAFSLAASVPHQSGVRTMNASASRAWATAPTADVLENWWGDKFDLSYYRKPGNELHSAYSVTRIQEELGFTAESTLEYLTRLDKRS